MKEDGKLMQTLIFVVFVYKYIQQQSNVYTPKAVRFLNSKLGKANCAKIEKKHVDVSSDFQI